MNWGEITNIIDGLALAVMPGALVVSIFIILVMGAQNVLYVIQLFLAYSVLRQRRLHISPSEAWQQLNVTTMPISLLVPGYNEEATIVENVRSMLSLHYPNFEVIVINDGSSDNTLKAVIDAYNLKPIVRPYEEAVNHKPIRGLYGSKNYPNLIVVDKENGGKSDALNAGINLARFPLFCAVDADSLLESDALLRAVQPFTEDPERVVAVGGTIRIANGCSVRAGRITKVDMPTNLVALFQVVEYLRAFLMARLAWSKLDALMLISGAFGIFKRGDAIKVGGYSHDTVGEDMEIIVKLHRYMREQGRDYRVHFVPDPVCWTEAPESLSVLGRQRRRWQRGSLEAFFKHKKMLLNPKYGVAGMLGFPHVLLVDVLGPPIEVLGYIMMPLFFWMGVFSLDFFLAYIALSFIFGVTISVGSLILEEMELRRFPKPAHLAILTAVSIIENFGYRQLNNLWRIMGTWHFMLGRKEWGKMTRAGFKKG